MRLLLLVTFALGLLSAGPVELRALAAPADSDADAAMAKGAAALEGGRFEEASAAFRQAADLYRGEGNVSAGVNALLRRAQAEQSLGEYRDAAQSLEDAIPLAEARGDGAQLAALLGALGNVRIAIGPADEAERALERASALAKELGDTALAAATLNNLGNHRASQGDPQGALRAYEEGASLATRAGSASLAARARANAARAALASGDARLARELADRAYAQARELPPSHDKADLLVHLGRSYSRLGATVPSERSALRLRSHQVLREAEGTAAPIGDARASSFALGYLAALYEEESRYAEALALTQQAIFQAQQVEAPDSLYLWHWQAGRLLRGLGQDARAIDSYGEAVKILEGLRHQLAIPYGGPRTSFEESVGSVYFELVDLLLRRAEAAEDREAAQSFLLRARDTVERLKRAELRDYFRDECVDALQARIRNPWELSRSAVVVYPIMLPDRTEILLSFGSAEIERHSVGVGRADLTQELRRFRERLEKRTTNQYRPHAQKLYDWLIRPFASRLRERGVDTLVFVPWGPLRTVPMAALHDGERFVIEEFAVAITPGIELTDPRRLVTSGAKLLLGGLSEAVEGFPPLEHVPQELGAIKDLHGGRILLDESFRLEKLRSILADEALSVVHFATHGEFSGEADQSFLLAHDGRLTLERLAEDVGLFRFRETPLELLTLSACETAQGDDRAALGLSGVAIKAGARSALATLWKVNDEAAAKLVVDFYAELRDPDVSRAQALQRAQRNLLEDPPHDHPGYWSAFLLIGSWL